MAVVKKDSGFSTTTVAVKLAELQGQQNQIASDVTEIKKVVQENAQAHGERLKVL
jgi:predicted nucleic acid-binding Zn finger protein